MATDELSTARKRLGEADLLAGRVLDPEIGRELADDERGGRLLGRFIGSEHEQPSDDGEQGKFCKCLHGKHGFKCLTEGF